MYSTRVSLVNGALYGSLCPIQLHPLSPPVHSTVSGILEIYNAFTTGEHGIYVIRLRNYTHNVCWWRVFLLSRSSKLQIQLLVRDLGRTNTFKD